MKEAEYARAQEELKANTIPPDSGKRLEALNAELRRLREQVCRCAERRRVCGFEHSSMVQA
jgi:hypothetical protein